MQSGIVMKKMLFGFALACAVTAALGAAAAEKYFIDSAVWGVYQEYLRRTSNGLKPGGFAITKDGEGAFYVWCADIHCMAGPGYGHDARTNCEREYDTECVVFAVRDDIRVEYEIVKR
jgi:hypothetical protein